MVPDLGPAFGVDFKGRPPRMSAIDFALWRRFVSRGRLPFLRVHFDVKVGGVPSFGIGVAENLRRAFSDNVRQRIDVVGDGVAGWSIIELRGAAGPGAIGSLVVYRDLWLEEPPDQRGVSLTLVTDVFPDNLLRSLKLAKIELVLV